MTLEILLQYFFGVVGIESFIARLQHLSFLRLLHVEHQVEDNSSLQIIFNYRNFNNT